MFRLGLGPVSVRSYKLRAPSHTAKGRGEEKPSIRLLLRYAWGPGWILIVLSHSVSEHRKRFTFWPSHLGMLTFPGGTFL